MQHCGVTDNVRKLLLSRPGCGAMLSSVARLRRRACRGPSFAPNVNFSQIIPRPCNIATIYIPSSTEDPRIWALSFVSLPVFVYMHATPILVHVVNLEFAIIFEVHNVAAFELAEKLTDIWVRTYHFLPASSQSIFRIAQSLGQMPCLHTSLSLRQLELRKARVVTYLRATLNACLISSRSASVFLQKTSHSTREPGSLVMRMNLA
jgi:hypothetical protein